MMLRLFKPVIVSCLLGLTLSPLVPVSHAETVDLKGLGRFDGWRENALIGYGLVVGLPGSGDTRRSGVTKQTLQNVLSRLGTNVTEDQISSRNAAIVIVVGTLPPSANVGDRISVTISSIGDARSLAGGTLLMTPLLGPDRNTYALAQGPLLTGGYNFESELNQQQRNFPTTARLENGATVESPVKSDLLKDGEHVSFFLDDPSFTTASRIANAVNQNYRQNLAWAPSADEVRIYFGGQPKELAGFLSEIEQIKVQPDKQMRIVINERTGTVVAGANVKISSVVVSQGDIKVTVRADNYAAQPSFISGFANDISSLIVTNTDLDVVQGDRDVVASFPSTTVGDLVQGLNTAGVDTHRLISILQAVKAAGGLHADIIVQ